MTFGVIGGLRIGAPLSLEEERRLYPIIEAGRDASARLAAGGVDAAERRRLSRVRLEGERAESALLIATLGLVRARVVERGYRFGGDELEAAGVEGLANAMRRFDPGHGARFATYANYWITKLVNQAVQQQSGLSDTEMRRAIAVQKLQRSSSTPLSVRVVARELGLDARRAAEALQLSRDLASRRFAPSTLGDGDEPRAPSEPADTPGWVIDELKRLCGTDFDDFWQHAHRTASLEELARGRGVSRQAMTKRIERCRRAVRESQSARRLEEWFALQ